ncbi:unnamed protein product [marine sediment metagenome]|uniref:Flp/Fap pilin component n=1 Tax=marine sediment metagenome TaxID=412755 RepID=X0Y4J1_9ZZZZ
MTDRIVIWVLTAVASLRNKLAEQRGQDLIEYALLGGLIAAALIAAFTLTGLTEAVGKMADGIGDCIDFDGDTTCAPFAAPS